jgi:colicin import membrane protein
MQNNGIRAASVIEAGLKLKLENRNVTGFALREMSGGGSPGKLRRIWEEHVNPTNNQCFHAIELLIEDVNNVASMPADLRIQEIQRLHDLQLKLVDKEKEEAANVNEELWSRLNEAVDQNLQLGRKLSLYETIFKPINISLT